MTTAAPVNKLRKVEVYKDGQWTEIEFKDIKKNDQFKLYDHTEDGWKAVEWEYEVRFVATENAWLNEDGIWTTNVLKLYEATRENDIPL